MYRKIVYLDSVLSKKRILKVLIKILKFCTNTIHCVFTIRLQTYEFVHKVEKKYNSNRVEMSVEAEKVGTADCALIKHST